MKLYNKILLFLGLKSLELSTLIFLPCLIGRLAIKFMPKIFNDMSSNFGLWFTGILVVMFLISGIILLALILYSISRFTNFNWKIVNKGRGIRWLEDNLF